jgi:hypothetical protein
MSEPQYVVVKAANGTYTVEIRDADEGTVWLQEGFASEQSAQDWAWEQRRMTAAADRWDQTSIGRMHRDD